MVLILPTVFYIPLLHTEGYFHMHNDVIYLWEYSLIHEYTQVYAPNTELRWFAFRWQHPYACITRTHLINMFNSPMNVWYLVAKFDVVGGKQKKHTIRSSQKTAHVWATSEPKENSQTNRKTETSLLFYPLRKYIEEARGGHVPNFRQRGNNLSRIRTIRKPRAMQDVLKARRERFSHKPINGVTRRQENCSTIARVFWNKKRHMMNIVRKSSNKHKFKVMKKN